MQCLFAVVCLWAVVSANAQYEYLLDERQPAPQPTGLLTIFVNALQEKGLRQVQFIDDLQRKNNAELIAFIRATGGITTNFPEKNAFTTRQNDTFWQAIVNGVDDIYWDLKQNFTIAQAVIEHEFRLVIDQPQVRSWLRDFRDLPRIGLNLALQAVSNRREQWRNVGLVYTRTLGTQMIATYQCQNKDDELNDRFYRLSKLGFEEQFGVVKQLQADLARIIAAVVQRGFELADNIYEVQVLALKNLIT